MLNQLVMVGRIAKDVEIIKEGEKSYAKMVLASQRSYKNADGVYETDFIPVILWNGIAENVVEYCKIGDLVGVKARVQNDKDGNVEFIADKVTFLSTSRKEEE